MQNKGARLRGDKDRSLVGMAVIFVWSDDLGRCEHLTDSHPSSLAIISRFAPLSTSPTPPADMLSSDSARLNVLLSSVSPTL